MPELYLPAWILWALLSAAFAALTAIFAKIGVASIDADLATFIRTLVIVVVLGAIVFVRGRVQPLAGISARTYLFLILSGLATGASWVCYFRALKLADAARVAPVDKLSVVLVAIFGVLFLSEHLALYNWLGVLLITAGVICIAPARAPGWSSWQRTPVHPGRSECTGLCKAGLRGEE
jgi:bacterial/archaeal transporter family protein